MKYFQHDTNALSNRKIRKIVRTHGAVGYGIWWAILECLYSAESDGFQIIADELWLEDLADQLRISDHRTLIRVLDTFSEIGLISSQLWADHVLYCEAIAERGDAYIQRRVKETEKKRAQRARKKALAPSLSPGDNEGTKGQSAIVPLADPDPDPDPNSYSDSNSFFLNKDLDLEEEKKEEESLTRSRVLETPIEVKPQNNEVSQMELATLSSNQDPDRSEQKTSSEDQSSAAPKKPQKEKKAKSKADCDPERFDRWWKGYIRLCKELGANSGNRIDAIAEWNALLKDGANPDDIDLGTLLFADEKRAEKAEKGKAFGVKNGCRFLSKKEWNDAIERANIDASTAIVDVEIVEESEPVNSSAIAPVTQHPNKVAGFDARFTQKSEAFLRWQELFKIEFMQLDLKRTPGNFDKAWQKWNERGLESQSIADICEGTALYFETQRNQLKTKGECYCLGVVNFLENDAWEISLRQRQIQQQFPVQKKVSPKTATDEERYESFRQEAIRRGYVNV